MGEGVWGPSVSVHVDQALARQYRWALIRDHAAQWFAMVAGSIALGALAVWWDGWQDSWSYLLLLLLLLGWAAFDDGSRLWREARLPVGHDLNADLDEVMFRVHAPGFGRELTLASFRRLERRGAVMRLEDGAGRRTPLPSALFTPEVELWCRDHARVRDLTAAPLADGWREVEHQPGLEHRLALAGVRRYQLRRAAWPLAGAAGVILAMALLVPPQLTVFVTGLVVIYVAGWLGQQYADLRKGLEFQYARQPVRIGPDGHALVIDSVNRRERIDPRAIILFERRKDLVFVRHSTAGVDRSLVFPAVWLAGLLTTARPTAPSI